MYLFLRTLNDIGFKRIFLRIRFEIRKIIDRKLFLKGRLFFSNFNEKEALWNFDLDIFDSKYKKFVYKNQLRRKQIDFTFLCEKKSFYLPLKWNDFGCSRLWQFNLHYFDWAKEWLEYRIEHNKWPAESSNLELLIDDWIDNNEIGIGDGWHSYTLSLRIRNWVYLFRACPELINKKRIKSLWMQICWLNTHQENSYGGNHLLENLITLVLAGLQFNGEYPSEIYSKAILKLEKELKVQILQDGGHFERSAGYHFLILSRLSELAFILRKLLEEIPKWLLEAITKMLDWANSVVLSDNSLPRFNDSSSDICSSPEIIIEYAETLLNDKKYHGKGLRKLIYGSKLKKRFENYNFKSNKLLIDLKETGWTILRPGNDIELYFKCGIPCPNYLPGHAHSDQLSFDIFRSGEPIIAETGTSIYQKSFERFFERSGAAHNILQLGLVKNFKLKQINWIEPVEVWDAFRVARKSKPIYRKFGENNDGSLWVEGEHDGYKKYGAFHKRFLKILKNKNGEIYFFLNDKVYVEKLMAIRIWFHLGNNQDKKILNPVIKEFREKHKLNFSWQQTWYSKKFGERIPRKSLCIMGFLDEGYHDFSLKLPLSK